MLAFAFIGELGDTLSLIFVGFLILLLVAPLVVPIKILIQERNSAGQGSIPWKSPFFKSKSVIIGRKPDNENQTRAPLLRNSEEPNAGENTEISVPEPNDAGLVTESQTWSSQSESNEEHIVREPRIGEDHTIFQAIQKFDFWLLFFVFLCGVGTGMAVINNMGQIGIAMGFSDVSIFVSLISIWGFFGRIGAGSISEHFLRLF